MTIGSVLFCTALILLGALIRLAWLRHSFRCPVCDDLRHYDMRSVVKVIANQTLEELLRKPYPCPNCKTNILTTYLSQPPIKALIYRVESFRLFDAEIREMYKQRLLEGKTPEQVEKEEAERKAAEEGRRAMERLSEALRAAREATGEQYLRTRRKKRE